MAKLNTNINTLMKKQVTFDFTLTGLKEFKFRMGIAKLLLRLTAFILNGNSTIKIETCTKNI